MYPTLQINHTSLHVDHWLLLLVGFICVYFYSLKLAALTLSYHRHPSPEMNNRDSFLGVVGCIYRMNTNT